MAPCIAEYGEGFPAYLGGRREAESVPWIAGVGELEWHLGTVAIAITREPAAIDGLASLEEQPSSSMSGSPSSPGFAT